MFQTDQTTASATLPAPAAAGTQGFFTNGNPGSGVAATIVDADFLNMIMMELVNVVIAAGETPSKTTYNQVLLAIKRLVQNQVVLTDTGAVNAYAVTNNPPLVGGAGATWVNGVVQQFVVAHTNNGPSTFSPDGLTPISIYGLGLQPLQQNEMFAGGTAILMKQTIAGVNGGNPICVLLECAGGAQQIPAATQPLHAVQLGQVGNRAGEVCHFATISPPTGFLAADGSAISRAVYAALFAAVTVAATGSVTNGSASITGVANASANWIGMPISGPGIPAGATVSNVSGTTVTISANATATNATDALVVAPFGVGDGITTFNVPDMRGVAPRGWDNGRGFDTGRVFGSYQPDSFASHTHTATSTTTGTFTASHSYWDGTSGTSAFSGSGSSGVSIPSGNISATTTTTNANTGGTETRPKNVALLACIKY